LSERHSHHGSGSNWGPWIRFYALLLLIFFEVTAFVFQNIEKKRLGYELSVLVKHKRRMIETRERQRSSVLEWERLEQVAGSVRDASLDLEANHWPVVRLDGNQ
jgi:hypothetical protein